MTVHSFSLRTKLLIFAAAVVLVPGVIYGVITVSSSRAAVARVVGRQLVGEARSAADQLAMTIRLQRGRLESFAGQDVMRELRIDDLDKRISSFLGSAKRGCPACVALLVIARDDRVIASSEPEWIGRRHTEVPGVGVSGAIVGPHRVEGDVSLLRINVPVPDPDLPDFRIGRLVALLDWERATHVVSRVRESLLTVGLDADVLVVDQDGKVIGGVSRSDGAWPRGAAISLWPPDDDESFSGGRIDAQAGMLVGDARLPGDLPPWRIVVAQSLDDAFAPVRRTAGFLAAALTGTLLVVVSIVLVAARQVTKPLAELTAAAITVGQGGIPTEVAVRSRDEIATLATAFNHMSIDLRRAERELVEAAKFAFVGELAAGVAHEVRTPLGVLRSSAQILERSLEPKDNDARELLQLLRDEVDRIDLVVTGLLELGRPHELRLVPVALGPILSRAALFAEAQARVKGISILCSRTVREAEVVCDSELIYQVLLNLIVNALQVLPVGGTVEVRLLAPHAGMAGFEVRDDGPGIPEDVRARIFEPFFTRRDGGTGLGLTFVQRVVQEHRGCITVNSGPRGGTVFSVELPTPQGAE